MSAIPATSVTLLKVLSKSNQAARWTEFYAKYKPMMLAYLNSHFSTLDADDIIQETMLVLIKKLPEYHYIPEERGHFHNYLTGIMRNKALEALAKRKRHSGTPLEEEDAPVQPPSEEELAAWKKALYEIALQQLLAQEGISSQTKEIFVQTAIEGKDPATVAEAFGITRNVVDQAKSRMVSKLRALIDSLQSTDTI